MDGPAGDHVDSFVFSYGYAQVGQLPRSPVDLRRRPEQRFIRNPNVIPLLLSEESRTIKGLGQPFINGLQSWID
jgi:hypothetical protein